MNERFRAFSFVDGISSVQPGVDVRGFYSVPSHVAEFPASLVAESVGQLAAWSAMAKLEFRFRPVAGLAARIELIQPVRPGQKIELAADLESVDNEAVSYSGAAFVDGKPVVQLEHCVGPMLPQEDFDDPDLLRERFAVLCSGGAASGEFTGLPAVPLEITGGEPGRIKRATIRVPESAPFFADHFPRRPVFPGTLLMNLNLQLAALLAAEFPASSGTWILRAVSDVKLRSFTPPGDVLECEAKLNEIASSNARIAVETKKGKKTVGSAKVLLALETLQ